jgi:hypothetical protein
MRREDAMTHDDHARRLERRVIESGDAPRELRAGALGFADGDDTLAEPHRTLVAGVVLDSARVTDAQVAAVLDDLGSQSKAFEVIMSAAVGAGLHRWRAAERVIGMVDDASS